MRLEAMAITMPDVADHPNRIPFEGILTVVDEASTRPPSGARGHRVILTRDATRAALPSLLGMAVDYAPKWDGHDARAKCGIITDADVIGNQLRVLGYLFGRDFPEVVLQLQQSEAGDMGMSYELADAHVADMRAEVWTLTRATFTGAAILLREKAAYRNTSFRLSASCCRNSSPMRESIGATKLVARSGWRFEKQSLGQIQRRKEAKANGR